MPVIVEYLPVGAIKGVRMEGVDSSRTSPPPRARFSFEPGAEAVLGYLFGHYLNIYIYQVMLDAKASEQAPAWWRCRTPRTAPRPDQDLSLHYNNLRQGNITKELFGNCGRPSGERVTWCCARNAQKPSVRDPVGFAGSTQRQSNTNSGVTMNKGKIVQVVGPVVDVEFPPDELPEIYPDALELRSDGRVVILEVQQHIGSDAVRTLAMDATDGLRRGTEVVQTGASISVPVGNETLGRMFNVVGEVIDERGSGGD